MREKVRATLATPPPPKEVKVVLSNTSSPKSVISGLPLIDRTASPTVKMLRPPTAQINLLSGEEPERRDKKKKHTILAVAAAVG